MSLFEIALVVSVIIAMYNLQQIKITLKQKGYDVEMFLGVMKDHRQFKALIQSETDRKTKVKYQQTLNGLYFSLFGVVLFAAMMLHQRLA
jgi:hypothetical protein